jgi:hypothetical protein
MELNKKVTDWAFCSSTTSNYSISIKIETGVSKMESEFEKIIENLEGIQLDSALDSVQ